MTFARSSPHPDVVFTLPPGGMTATFVEHLGAAFLRAVLAEADISSGHYRPRRNVGLSTFATYLRETKPRVVGLTAYETSLRTCRALVAVVRATLPESVVVVGGPNATFTPDETLERLNADVVVRGAAEGSITELVSTLLGSPRRAEDLPGLLGGISNLALRTKDGVFHTPVGDLSSFPGGRFRTLDDLPSPYQTGFVEDAEVGLLTARGCNQHCTYCSFAAISARRVHYHSVERVLDDLAALARTSERGVSTGGHITVNDDAFTLSAARARSICEGILERGLRVRLVCETRVDRVEPDLLRLMRRAGFVGVMFGVESAVPRVLRAIGKCQDPRTLDDPRFEREREYVDRVRRAVEAARRAGVEPSVSVMGGLPGESARDFRRTLAFVESLGVRQYAHNILRVMPGTPLHAARQSHRLEAGRDPRSGEWRTEHAYEVRRIAPVGGSASIRNRQQEARDITDALCGRARPDRGGDGSAWAVVIHDRQPDDRLARWISDVLAVHGVVVVASRQRGRQRARREAWLAALEESRAAWGLVALVSRHRSTRRTSILRSSGTGTEHEFALADSYTAVRSSLRIDGRGRCSVPIWIASRARALPRTGVAAPPLEHTPQIADACRWWSLGPRCAHPSVLHVWSDDSVTACWGGPALGKIGDSHRALAARGSELTSAGSARCPIASGTATQRDLSRMELKSMLAWLLGGEASHKHRGTRPWRRRRPERAQGERKVARHAPSAAPQRPRRPRRESPPGVARPAPPGDATKNSRG